MKPPFNPFLGVVWLKRKQLSQVSMGGECEKSCEKSASEVLLFLCAARVRNRPWWAQDHTRQMLVCGIFSIENCLIHCGLVPRAVPPGADTPPPSHRFGVP